MTKIVPLLLLAPFAALAAEKGDWHTDFSAAMEKAEEENKLVMIEFHGSDWCPPCIKLNEKVLATEAFLAFAEEALVLVSADFPRERQLPAEQREHNRKLGKRLGLQYFPTVVLLDTEGNVLEKLVGYPEEGLEGFLATLQPHRPAGAAEAESR
ncbi:MAG: thioredoxin fold domain-containing protein [Verrucomicrobia bacterium]|jgi:thiol-disulfide isomerase/thioredoxin|nr:thioredoxin fold domain-containing protein [Verrucomicrobiota bacterium]